MTLAQGLVFLYAIITAFSLARLKRGRAILRQYLAWPVTALVTQAVVGLAVMSAEIEQLPDRLRASPEAPPLGSAGNRKICGVRHSPDGQRNRFPMAS